MNCFYRRLSITLIWVGGITVIGCGKSRFIPTEPITASTANRLAPAYSRSFGDYTLERLLLYVDMPNIVENVAIDSTGHLLYLHRRCWTSFLSGLPTGIYTIDMRTGTELHRTRVPSRPDMTGERMDTQGDSYYDISRHLALHLTGYDGHGAAILLDLARDDPSLIGYGPFMSRGSWRIRAAPHPVVDDRRFLLIREQFNTRPYAPSHLVYVDRQTRQVSEEYSLSPVGRDPCYIGGIGHYVLATISESNDLSPQLIVLSAENGEIKHMNRLRLDPGWQFRNHEIDWINRWWIIGEVRSNRQNRIRIYEVPSLELVAEIPNTDDRHIAYSPATHVLAVIPEHDRKSLVLYQLPEGCQIAQIGLPDFDHKGDWFLRMDPSGMYVGIYGCQWVHLFAVRPSVP